MSDSTKHDDRPEFLRDLPREGDLTTPNNYFRVMQNSVLARMSLERQPAARPTPRRRSPVWWRRPVVHIAFVFLLVVAGMVWLNVAQVDPEGEILTEIEATEYILEQYALDETDAEALHFENLDDELNYYLDDLAF